MSNPLIPPGAQSAETPLSCPSNPLVSSLKLAAIELRELGESANNVHYARHAERIEAHVRDIEGATAELDDLLRGFHDAAMCGLDDSEIREKIVAAFCRRSGESRDTPSLAEARRQIEALRDEYRRRENETEWDERFANHKAANALDDALTYLPAASSQGSSPAPTPEHRIPLIEASRDQFASNAQSLLDQLDTARRKLADADRALESHVTALRDKEDLVSELCETETHLNAKLADAERELRESLEQNERERQRTIAEDRRANDAERALARRDQEIAAYRDGFVWPDADYWWAAPNPPTALGPFPTYEEAMNAYLGTGSGENQ